MAIIVDNKQRIPLTAVESYNDFVRQSTIHIYKNNGKDCYSCVNIKTRPQFCGKCPSYKKYMPVKATHNMELGEHLACDIGFDLSDILDDKKVYKYPDVPMKNPYKFYTKKLYPYQKDACISVLKSLRKGTSGVLLSKPRTGKTVMASCIALKHGQKTIIIAHQNDLLQQMYDTLMTEGLFTNCGDYEKSVKICKTLKDFEEHDICLTTYQSIGKKDFLTKNLASMFGLLICDEIHKSGADWYSEVLSVFNCPRLGLTGTNDRKDGKYKIVLNIIGDVICSTPAKSMVPSVSVLDLPYKSKANFKAFTRYSERVEKDIPSQKFIIKFLKRDIAKGHNILIPVYRKDYAYWLSRVLSRKGIGNVTLTGDVRDTARSKLRTITLDKARNDPDVKVTIAIRGLLTGVNVPRWSMIYEIYPISNEPNFIQEYQRICTPMPNKNSPVVRYFLPDWEMYLRCFKNMAIVLKKEGAIFTKTADKKLETVMLRFNSRELAEYYPKHKSKSKRKYVSANVPLKDIMGSLDTDLEDARNEREDLEEVLHTSAKTRKTKRKKEVSSLNDF